MSSISKYQKAKNILNKLDNLFEQISMLKEIQKRRQKSMSIDIWDDKQKMYHTNVRLDEMRDDLVNGVIESIITMLEARFKDLKKELMEMLK